MQAPPLPQIPPSMTKQEIVVPNYSNSQNDTLCHENLNFSMYNNPNPYNLVNFSQRPQQSPPMQGYGVN